MERICFDENAKLNLVLWGDPQISPFAPERLQRLRAACATLAAAPGRADVLALTGDVAEFGRKPEYAAVTAALNAAAGKVGTILCVSGNHDVRLRPYRRQLKVFNDFLSGVKNARKGGNDRYWFACGANGYPLLCMGTDKTAFEGTRLSDRQLTWLEARLFEAQKAGLPAFVFNHQPLRKTNGLPETWLGKGDWRGSVGWESDRLRRVLEGHGPVFYCTGHLHYGITGFHYERSGHLQMISAPPVGCANHGPKGTPGQGLVLSVYDGHAVLRGAHFVNGTFMDETAPGAVCRIDL